MGKIPFALIPLVINLIRAIFKVEKTDLSGAEKKKEVINESIPELEKIKDVPTIIRWVLFLSKIIDVVVRLFNDEFGKNGWKDAD